MFLHLEFYAKQEMMSYDIDIDKIKVKYMIGHTVGDN